MDKNSWIGLLLIMAILLGWSYYTRPSEEQIQRERARRDSIARVEQQRQIEIELQKSQAAEQAQIVQAQLRAGPSRHPHQEFALVQDPPEQVIQGNHTP